MLCALLLLLWQVALAAVAPPSHGVGAVSARQRAPYLFFTVQPLKKSGEGRTIPYVFSEHYYVTIADGGQNSRGGNGTLTRHDLAPNTFLRGNEWMRNADSRDSIRLPQGQRSEVWILDQYLILLGIDGTLQKGSISVYDLEMMAMVGKPVQFTWHEKYLPADGFAMDSNRQVLTMFSRPNVAFDLKRNRYVKWVHRASVEAAGRARRADIRNADAPEFIPNVTEPLLNEVVVVHLPKADDKAQRTPFTLHKAEDELDKAIQWFHRDGRGRPQLLGSLRDALPSAYYAFERAEMPHVYGRTSHAVYSSSVRDRCKPTWAAMPVFVLAPFALLRRNGRYVYDPWSGHLLYILKKNEFLLAQSDSFLAVAEENPDGSTFGVAILGKADKSKTVLETAFSDPRDIRTAITADDAIVVHNQMSKTLYVGDLVLASVETFNTLGRQMLFVVFASALGEAAIWDTTQRPPVQLPARLPISDARTFAQLKLVPHGKYIYGLQQGQYWVWNMPKAVEHKSREPASSLTRRSSLFEGLASPASLLSSKGGTPLMSPKSPKLGPPPKPKLMHPKAETHLSKLVIEEVVPLGGTCLLIFAHMQQLAEIDLKTMTILRRISNPLAELEPHRGIQVGSRGAILLITTDVLDYFIRLHK